jgi:glycosyltransferase involved in cell wall biosynthesis
MQFSIIIPTVGRCDSLRRLLCSISELFIQSGVEYEVLVVNNALDTEIASRVDQITGEFQTDGNGRLRVISVPTPGKCKAVNAAIKQASGRILAFFDDDVEVTPGWLNVAAEFFRGKSFDAMQGPILVPVGMQSNEEFRRAQNRYRTIHFVQYPPSMSEINTLTGANMAIRREVFERVGLFDERLGPGQSGMSEDVEFAQRIIAGGGKIGYRHDAGVYHEVDWSRLSESYFRLRHEQQGRSRLLYKQQSLFSILPNIMRSLAAFTWYSLTGNERKTYRAKGRYYHYCAMLREKMKSSASEL